jgi:hypothetical protein
MLLQNYFYFNGVPYEQLPINKRNKIDRLINCIKVDDLYQRMLLYQDHYFNIQDSDDLGLRQQFQSDLPDDLTMDLVSAYLKTIEQLSANN